MGLAAEPLQVVVGEGGEHSILFSDFEHLLLAFGQPTETMGPIVFARAIARCGHDTPGSGTGRPAGQTRRHGGDKSS